MRARAPGDVEQALARVLVARREGHEARVRVERPRVVAEPLVAQLGDAAAELAPLVLRHLGLEAHLENAHEIAHLVARRVDALEDDGGARAQGGHVEALLDQLARLAAAVVGVDDGFELVERLLRVAELREPQRAEAEPEAHRLLPLGELHPLLEERRENRSTARARRRAHRASGSR